MLLYEEVLLGECSPHKYISQEMKNCQLDMWVAQRVCGISVLGSNQNSPGHSLNNLLDLLSAGAWPGDLQRSPPIHMSLWLSQASLEHRQNWLQKPVLVQIHLMRREKETEKKVLFQTGKHSALDLSDSTRARWVLAALYSWGNRGTEGWTNVPNPHSKSMDSPGSQGISVSDLALNPFFHAISQKNHRLPEYAS